MERGVWRIRDRASNGRVMGVSVIYHSNPSIAVIVVIVAAVANRTDAASYTSFYAAVVNVRVNDC